MILGSTRSILSCAVPKSKRIKSSGKSSPTKVKFLVLLITLPAESTRAGRLKPKNVSVVSTTCASFRLAARPRYVTWNVSLGLVSWMKPEKTGRTAGSRPVGGVKWAVICCVWPG